MNAPDMDSNGPPDAMPRKLDFAIAGAQKGGTSTLDTFFRRHPQIQMARGKETHVFDDETADWANPDYTRLDAYFPADDGRLRGEATPITLYWRPAIRRLRDYNPDIKLILLLRDPVARAFSNWRQEFGAGRETLPFARAIREGRERVRREAEVEGLHRYYSYIDRSRYGGQLAYLSAHFPRAQIHCEISEAFFAAPAPTLRRLANFLEIDPFPDALSRVHRNPALPAIYPSALTEADAAYLTALFRDDVAAVEVFLGRRVAEWRGEED